MPAGITIVKDYVLARPAAGKLEVLRAAAARFLVMRRRTLVRRWRRSPG